VGHGEMERVGRVGCARAVWVCKGNGRQCQGHNITPTQTGIGTGGAKSRRRGGLAVLRLSAVRSCLAVGRIGEVTPNGDEYPGWQEAVDMQRQWQ
jgi:hypothetical protein